MISMVSRQALTTLQLAFALNIFTFVVDQSSALGQCLKDTRQIALPDGSARLRSYLCQPAADPSAKVVIEFHRLSEATAGSLLTGNALYELANVFGKTQFVENPVYVEVKKIYDQFATESEADTCFKLQVATPAGGVQYSKHLTDKKKSCVSQRTLHYLGFPNEDSYFSRFDLALPDDAAAVQKRPDWPAGYNFHYFRGDGCKPDIPITCTRIWRPADVKDLREYDARWKTYNKSIGNDDAGAGPEYVKKVFWSR